MPVIVTLAALVPGAVARAGEPVETETETESATAAAAAEPSRAEDRFVKGELIHVGTRELLSRYGHGGVRVGPHFLSRELYLGIDPGFAIYPDRWGVSLHVPLNFRLAEAGFSAFGGFAVRTADWDEPADIARVIRFVSYGRHESSLYFSVSSLRPHTLGHGELIREYQPNIDLDRSMTGAVFEAYNRWGGVQLQLNDITFTNRIFGALGFVKPLGMLEDPRLSSLSLGFEYAGDLRAPRCVQVSESDRRCVPGSGNALGLDPATGEPLDQTFVRTDLDLGRPVVEETDLHALGFSGEMRVYSGDRSDLKVFLTWHQFLTHGDGLAGGLSARITTGDAESIHAFRLKGEYRNFATDFLPGYFDTYYEVTKFQYRVPRSRYQITPTKYQAVFGDPENGFPIEDTARRNGFRLEASWAYFERSRDNKKASFGLALEDSTARGDTNFYAHFELPFLGFVQAFGTFMRLNSDGLGGLFSHAADDIVILTGLRFQVLPIMFVNLSYTRSYQIVRSAGRELHLGNDRILDVAGQPSSFFVRDPIFENIQTLLVDIELGWESRE